MTTPYPCLDGPIDSACPQTPTYPRRECTSGAAWWGSQVLGKTWPLNWGNADNWPSAARAAGFVVNGSCVPNSVMCIPPNTNDAGPKGHVAFVTGTPVNGKVSVIEVNWKPEYGWDSRDAAVANCEYIHIAAPAPKPPIPQPIPQEDPTDMLYLFNTGAPGIWCLYSGKYFHVTPDDIAAFEALMAKPIQTIGAVGHAVLLATYGAP